MNKLTKDQLVDAVLEHAKANYERGGWDFVVECLTSEEVAGYIGDAKTEFEAIDNVAEKYGIALQEEQRQAIRNEIF
jgi:uncharacterized protein (DUF111 family)